MLMTFPIPAPKNAKVSSSQYMYVPTLVRPAMLVDHGKDVSIGRALAWLPSDVADLCVELHVQG